MIKKKKKDETMKRVNLYIPEKLFNEAKEMAILLYPAEKRKGNFCRYAREAIFEKIARFRGKNGKG